MANNNISNLNDLCNLKFFSDSGVEIYAEKQYVITWKLITNNKSLYQDVEGYILGDIEKTYQISRETGEIKYEYYRLRPDTLTIGFTKNPKVIIPPYHNGKNPNGVDIDNIIGIRNKIHNAIAFNANGKHTQVEITIHLLDSNYTLNIDSALFFDADSYIFEANQRINIGYNDDFDDETNNDYTLVYTVTNADFFKVKEIKDNKGNIQQFGTWNEIKKDENGIYSLFDSTRDAHPYVYYLLEPDEKGILMPTTASELSEKEYYTNKAYIDAYESREFVSKVLGIAQMFPFIRYNGSFMQEKTSTGFIAANTIIIFEKTIDASGESAYERPLLQSDNGWVFSLECPENGELKLIEINADNEINQINSKQFRLSYIAGEDDYRLNQPITAAIGVVAEDEGCYLNYLGFYIYQLNEPDIPFFMGMLTIKTEIIGEDERYRTLLENFGIPDPINYTKVFYNSEYQEALTDYQLVNQKSKELMLTYDQIFPFAGTYKALINALLYLGYTDIIIKEWYKFFDTNNRERDVAFDAIDVRQNKISEILYKKYNINANDDSTRLSKLNWLSMVYHINEIIDENGGLEEINAYVVEDNTIINETKLYFDSYLTLPIYAYRTDEITAKLHYLKKWLEAYIIGLNARIIEITGEGIYYAPLKGLIYSTGHLLLNFELTEYVTPKVLNVSDFEKSTADITCTIAELNNIRFKDTGNKTFGLYTLHTVHKKIADVDIEYNISNPVEIPVFGDEYQFDLKITPETGIIYQPRTSPSDNALIIRNNNLEILNSNSNYISFEKPLPIITLETANIRNLTGTWERNVEWLIQERIDDKTYETVYFLKNIGTYVNMPDEIAHNTHIQLIPTENASLIYTANNKWRAPMLIFKGYKFNINFDKYPVEKTYFDIPANKEFILEIIKGRISFSWMPSNKDVIFNDIDKSIELFNTEILFKPDFYEDQWYQKIDIQYTYTSERKPFKGFDSANFVKDINNIEIPTKLNNPITDEDINKYLLNLINYTADNVFLNEYVENTNAREIAKSTLIKLKKCNIKNYINNVIKDLYEKYYTSYKSITTPVHHLGNYDITVKMYDRYNNIYINKKKDLANVSALPFGFNIFMNQAYSNNKPDFSNRNKNGGLLLHPIIYKDHSIKGMPLVAQQAPADKKVLALLQDWIDIKYPVIYDLYDILNNKDNYDTLSYYNYTYALNLPKAGDTLILSNHAIQIRTFEYVLDKNTTVITLYDLSDKNKRLLLAGESIMICLYDKTNIKLIDTIGPFTVESLYTVNNQQYEGEVHLQGDVLTEYENATLNYYIINTTEYDITLDDIILSDDGLYDRFILPGEIGKQHYQANDVIKVNYYCNTISYHTIKVDYEYGSILHNALYDPLYPAITVIYEGDIEPKNYQLHKGYENSDIKLELTLYIKHILLFEYQYYDDKPIVATNNYREGKWTVTDLLEHQQNKAEFDIISWKNTIKPILEGKLDTFHDIQQSTDVTFSDTKNEISIRFADETITHSLYNSISYSVERIIVNEKFVKNIGRLPEYVYVLNAPLDVWFMQKYANNNIYDTKIKVMYPYFDLVHYHATVTKNGELKEESFGVYNYSLLKTTFEYDVDNMFLDSYIDNNFIGRIYKFDPNNIRNIKVDEADCILLKENNTIYNYYEFPVTIPYERTILVSPVITSQFNELDPLLTYTWEWKYRAYNDLNDIEYHIDTTQTYSKYTLFICQNKTFCIKPNTYGSNDIILSVTDKYGNTLVNNSTGRVYVTNENIK